MYNPKWKLCTYSLTYEGVKRRNQATSRVIRELKQLRWRRQRKCKKTVGSINKNNSTARALRFLVHILDVHCTTNTWNHPMWRFMEDMDILGQIFPSLFEHRYKALKNSTPGCLHLTNWAVQIEVIKFKRMQIHVSFLVMFSVHCHHHHHCLRSLLTQMEERGITKLMFRMPWFGKGETCQSINSS